MQTKTRLRNKGYIKDKSNFDEGIKLWASFYRANIHRLCTDYLKIDLFPFQMILLYLMNKNTLFLFIASRGLGKSFLVSVFCCCKCILEPGHKVIIASASKSQAKILISQKIGIELQNMSPNLRREIAKIQVNQNDIVVHFKNGSTITAVTSGESARGYRGTILVVDECRLVSKKVLDSILRPMLTVVRMPGYKKKAKYKDYPLQENQELMMTSAHYKDNYVYAKFMNGIKDMCKTGNTFVCDLSYQLAVEHGLLTEHRVNAIKNEEDMDEATFQMEMLGKFFGEKSNSFYKSAEINPCRSIYKSWLPPTDLEYLAEKDKLRKKYYLKKQGGEIRIIGCDISVMGGARNDASVFTLMRLLPSGEDYIRQVVYIESMEGGNSNDQARRIKELFYDFQADYLALDAQGVGMGVYDSLAKVTYDTERDEEYPAFRSFNDEKMFTRAEKNALPVIFTIKVARVELNHEIAMSLKDCFQKRKIKLLINDMQGKDFLIEKLNMLKKSPEEQARMLKPYLQTTALVNELINLEYSLNSGFIRLREKSTARKDRYSSLSYANYLAKQLEKELKETKSNNMFVSLW